MLRFLFRIAVGRKGGSVGAMTRGFLPLLALVLATGARRLPGKPTDFRAFTSAGAQQLDIERTPRPLPDVRLSIRTVMPFALSTYKGRTVLIDFIYTRCPTICGFSATISRACGARRRPEPSTPIDLLSISFDPQNDDRDALKRYGERFGAVAPHWRIAATTDASGLAALLETFGVVVIPDGMGGYIHTSAVYVVDARGRLARMLDPNSPPQLFAQALRTATP